MKTALIVCPAGYYIDQPVAYGTYRAILAMGQSLKDIGYSTQIWGLARSQCTHMANFNARGFISEKALRDAVRTHNPVALLVCVTRSDVIPLAKAEHILIYHHSPHRIDGMYATTLRAAVIPVIVPSQCLQSQLITEGLSRSQIYVAPNGYNKTVFHLNTQPERPQHSIVLAAYHAPYKGTDIALRGFQLLRNQFPDATLDIYGHLPPWQTRRRHLMARHWLNGDKSLNIDAIQLDIPGCHFRGETDPGNLADAFRRSSILIMPSRIPETFGLVSVEAQACGCIPVLPRTGGFPETLKEGATGYLYEPNTPHALANVISDIWRHSGPSPKMRTLASEWVSSHFSWDSLTPVVQQAIRSDEAPKSRNIMLSLDRSLPLHFVPRMAHRAKMILQYLLQNDS